MKLIPTKFTVNSPSLILVSVLTVNTVIIFRNERHQSVKLIRLQLINQSIHQCATHSNQALDLVIAAFLDWIELINDCRIVDDWLPSFLLNLLINDWLINQPSFIQAWNGRSMPLFANSLLLFCLCCWIHSMPSLLIRHFILQFSFWLQFHSKFGMKFQFIKIPNVWVQNESISRISYSHEQKIIHSESKSGELSGGLIDWILKVQNEIKSTKMSEANSPPN